MARIIDAFTQFFDGAGDPLVDGHLQFVESGSNNTDKNTYADVNLTIANTNPVRLDGEGRCPSIFGTGVYKAILFADDGLGNPGIQIQQFDPVGGTLEQGAFSDWVATAIYNEDNTVTSSTGKLYRSLTNNNLGNEPDTDAVNWEEILFNSVWNSNVEYGLTSSVFGSDGVQYKSLVANNIANNPVTDGGINWLNTFEAPAASMQILEIIEVAAPVAAVVFTNFEAGFRLFRIDVVNAASDKAAQNNASLVCQTSTDGGVVFASSSGDYFYGNSAVSNLSTNAKLVVSASASTIKVGSGFIDIVGIGDPLQHTRLEKTGYSYSRDATGFFNNADIDTGSTRAVAELDNAIRLIEETGANIDQGTFTLTGIL